MVNQRVLVTAVLLIATTVLNVSAQNNQVPLALQQQQGGNRQSNSSPQGKNPNVQSFSYQNGIKPYSYGYNTGIQPYSYSYVQPQNGKPQQVQTGGGNGGQNQAGLQQPQGNFNGFPPEFTQAAQQTGFNPNQGGGFGNQQQNFGPAQGFNNPSPAAQQLPNGAVNQAPPFNPNDFGIPTNVGGATGVAGNDFGLGGGGGGGNDFNPFGGSQGPSVNLGGGNGGGNDFGLGGGGGGGGFPNLNNLGGNSGGNDFGLGGGNSGGNDFGLGGGNSGNDFGLGGGGGSDFPNLNNLGGNSGGNDFGLGGGGSNNGLNLPSLQGNSNQNQLNLPNVDVGGSNDGGNDDFTVAASSPAGKNETAAAKVMKAVKKKRSLKATEKEKLQQEDPRSAYSILNLDPQYTNPDQGVYSHHPAYKRN